MDCSTAALNLDWMGLDRAEGINLVCPVAQGHGKWKNEHMMYRLSQCFKCVHATAASHLGWNPLSFGLTVRHAFHKTEQLSSLEHTCHCDRTANANFSDTLHLIKANENSHYMCSEVSLTYGNTHVSYGCNLPCMWIFPEDFLKVFFVVVNLPYVWAFFLINIFPYSC